MNLTRSQVFRFVALIVLLSVVAFVLHKHDKPEILPPRQPLSSFPLAIGDWQGTPLSLSADDLSVLGPGEFLLRNYRSSSGELVNLYIAYYPSQRTGDNIHSPKNCLPGDGWTALESERLSVRNPDGSTAIVNRYIVAKGLSRSLVLYWYQAHGRVVASEYVAKIQLVEDAIRMDRTDGALVRIVVPFAGPGDLDAAQKIAVEFRALIDPRLDQYIPR